jgi:hypothetical protein
MDSMCSIALIESLHRQVEYILLGASHDEVYMSVPVTQSIAGDSPVAPVPPHP